MPMVPFRRRAVGLIFMILVFGAGLGTLLGELIGFLMPEGVVKQFFLQSVNWGVDPVTLDLLVTTVTFGIRVKFNVMSIAGFAGAYYFLRYFR